MIFNVNKSKNWTSADVVAYIKGKYNFKKVGHAGTLDPLATGVLVVLANNDTKKQDTILHSQKEYVADISFGIFTDTYDMEGDLKFSEKQVTLKELSGSLPGVLAGFVGEYEQEVPPYSAVKVQGKKLYEIARKSNDINEMSLPRKKVIVTDIQIMDIFDKSIIKDEKELVLPTAKLKISCSSGFYVRSLANDLGIRFGTSAVLSDLVRTRVGNYTIEESKDINDLEFDGSYYYL